MRSALFLACLFPFAVAAQLIEPWSEYRSRVRGSVDSNFVDVRTDQFLLRAIFTQNNNALFVTDGNGKELLSFSSNSKLNFGLGFNWRFIGLSFVYGFDVLNPNQGNEGTSRHFDFQLSGVTRKFLLEGTINSLKGYHVRTDPEFLEWWTPAPGEEVRSDIRTTEVSGLAAYIFNNRKFSMRAPWVRNEIQIKSAGSPLAGVYLQSFNVKADAALVDQDVEVPDEIRVISGDYLGFGIAGGYSYTFTIWKRGFVNLTAMFGLGAQRQKQEFANSGITNDIWVLEFASDARTSLGWNWENAFLAFTTKVSAFVLNQADNANLEKGSANFRLTVGRRFPNK